MDDKIKDIDQGVSFILITLVTIAVELAIIIAIVGSIASN